ncbi:hypothetical protein D9757_010721 [Collybiopsis confluens]|uniref:Integrase catalytic domain-containing protein n=1 Tax=Collybiopsis confluens TaxID=2823264 RepID=A0A8H5GZN1_9AGAR|nr:hypothetical protein D9757_010721 [Collybiopsis confluens]
MSDSTTSAYRIQHLSGVENYSTWKIKMLDILTDMGLEDYALGAITRPNDATAAADWSKKDRQTLSAIRLRVGDEPWFTYPMQAQPNRLGAHYLICINPKEQSASFKGEDINEHIRTMTRYRKELAALNSKISDDEFSITLLTSLPDSWDSFIQGVNTSSLSNSTALIARILEQARRKIAKPALMILRFPPIDSRARAANHHPHLRIRHATAAVAPEEDQPTETDYAFMGQDSGYNNLPPDTWLIDSACTKHIVRNKSLFSTYSETPGHSVKGQGTAAIATHSGKHAFNIALRNALHVPDAPFNLISVGCMTQAGFTVKFAADSLSVFAPGSSSREVIHGKRAGNLFVVETTKSSPRFASSLQSPPDTFETLAFPSIPASRTWKDWHRTFGHINAKQSIRILLRGMYTCQAKCPIFSPEAERKYTEIGEMTFTDVWGPARVNGINRERYYVSFTDGATRRTVIYFMKQKLEVEEKIKAYVEYIKTQTGKRCKAFRFDNGGEYISAEVKRYLSGKGIHSEYTAAYSPQQNGVAERLNRTLIEHARAMLAEHDLPLFLWPEAVAYAVYLKNRSPTRALDRDITPDEAFWKKKPDVSTLREFGSPCWVLRQDGKNQKLTSKSRPFHFTGLSDESRAWRYFNPESRKIQTSRNVIFNTKEVEDDSPATEKNLTSGLEGEQRKANNSEIKSVESPPSELNQDTLTKSPQQPSTPLPMTPLRSLSPLTPLPSPSPSSVSTPSKAPRDISSTISTENIISGKRTTRSAPTLNYRLLNNPDSRSPKRPDAWKTRVPNSSDAPPEFDTVAFAFPSFQQSSVTEPLTVDEARSRPDWPKWKEAMDAEIEQLNKLNTYKLTQCPPDRVPIANKWVYRVKRDADGKIIRYKARLVAKGFSQIPGIDFDETFAPVVRMETVRLLISIAARYKLRAHVVDVIGAYLNGKLDEEIYMTQPECYEDGTTRVCKLERSLYGLKQAGRVWNLTLDSSFKELGFTRLLSDQCVYIRRSQKGIVIVAVHVDDMSIFASSDELMTETEVQLESKFSINKLGPLRQLLGMEIRQTEDSIILTQTQYLTRILDRFGMTDCKPVATPMDTHIKLSRLPENESHPDIKAVYQNIIGSLMYAAITTRPDISFAVQALSQFNTNPGPIHLTAAKRILRYLKGTLNLGIKYSSLDDFEPVLFSDADWGNGIDDRKSISGYVSTHAGGAVTWNSKKQPTVALSSMEAEYLALSATTREALWLRTLFAELGLPFKHPLDIFVDNQGTIAFAQNSGFHARSKHIDIRHHFIRENITSNKVSIHYCATEENIADILTKGLDRNKHEHFLELLGMYRA